MAPTEESSHAEGASLCLRVKTADGKSFNVDDVSSASTVLDLKTKCAAPSGVAATHQRLHLKGTELKNYATLEDAKLVNNATLFLTKAASWKQELHKAPSGTVPCAGGCGFFGTARTDNFCSKCFAQQSQSDRERIWSGIFAEDDDDDDVTPSKKARVE